MGVSKEDSVPLSMAALAIKMFADKISEDADSLMLILNGKKAGNADELYSKIQINLESVSKRTRELGEIIQSVREVPELLH